MRLVPPAYKGTRLDNIAQEMDDALTKHWTLLNGSIEQQNNPEGEGKIVDKVLNFWRNYEVRANFRVESHLQHENIFLVRTR